MVVYALVRAKVLSLNRKERLCMLWFVLRYAIWSLLLFALVFFETYSPFYFINVFLTDATIYITGLWITFMEIPVTLSGNSMLFEHGMHLLILNECNGLTPLLLYLAAILAYPTRYRIKIKWFVGGTIVLLTLNMVRIVLITLLVIDHPDSFEFAHNVVGRYAIGAVTLYLFYFFTTHVTTCVPYGIILNGNNCHSKPSLKK